MRRDDDDFEVGESDAIAEAALAAVRGLTEILERCIQERKRILTVLADYPDVELLQRVAAVLEPDR